MVERCRALLSLSECAVWGINSISATQWVACYYDDLLLCSYDDGVCVCVYACDQWLQYSQRILNFDCIPISKQSTKCLLPTLLCMNRCAPTSPCMEQCLPSQVYSILPSNNLQILFVLFIYCINWVIMNITRSWKNLINYTFTSNKTMQ